jgi:hypothetical protein
MAKRGRKPKTGSEDIQPKAASSRKRNPAAGAQKKANAPGEPISQAVGGKLKEQIGIVKGLAETTSNVVQKAASILEEEIAAGIVAARQVEEQFINVKDLRAENPDAVMQKFRRDVHQAVDIIMDLVNVASRSVDDLTKKMISINGGTGQPSPAPTNGRKVPNLTIPNPVKAGTSTEMPMTLQNDSDKSTETFELHSTDLVDSDGNRILAEQIKFAPASLAIGPRNSETVKINVTVPTGTVAGTYSGLIQATKFDQLQAILTVQVG